MLALAGFGWLLAQLAGAGVVQQYGLVLMIPLLVWGILGSEVARALCFPLFFCCSQCRLVSFCCRC
jgi:hypothetical protein